MDTKVARACAARRRVPPTHLNGKVASELSASNYGRMEWWLLLEPVSE